MKTPKIHIPSSEIRHPNGYHSDQLGFTFRWNGHFLRGILPESAEIARHYFESGFIDEIYNKGLFPKTWISDFENEEFAFIIEHEMMTPLIYATDWNFSMLRDAAVLVLTIAKVAKKYGYNMIDCHKLNVMFKNSRPMYVDLGSFIPYKEGSSAWLPYLSFLRSYFYILDIWYSGAGQIAKRSMTPGVEFSSRDYHLFKNVIWRCFPSYMEKYYTLYARIHTFAATGYDNIIEKNGKESSHLLRTGLLMKRVLNALKPIKSQRQCSLDRMRSRIQRMHLPDSAKLTDDNVINEDLVSVINNHTSGRTATIFETSSPGFLSSLLSETDLNSIIAVHENEYLSDAIYKEVRNNNLAVTCTYYQISEGGLLIRGRFPEDRFKSDIAIVGEYHMGEGRRGLMSALWIIQERMSYSSMGTEIFVAPGDRQDLVEAVKEKYNTDVISLCGGEKICLVIRCK